VSECVLRCVSAHGHESDDDASKMKHVQNEIVQFLSLRGPQPNTTPLPFFLHLSAWRPEYEAFLVDNKLEIREFITKVHVEAERRETLMVGLLKRHGTLDAPPWMGVRTSPLLFSSRVVAIGDLHGDIEAARACLRIAECVNEKDEWIAPRGTCVVVLGDVVDRFREGQSLSIKGRGVGEVDGEELKLLEMLNSLSRTAYVRGSAVCRLVGNHEIMQSFQRSSGSTLYSSPVARAGRYESFVSGDLGRAMRDGAPLAIVQVGSFVFVHGGVNEPQIDYANKKGKSLIELANEILYKYLRWSRRQLMMKDEEKRSYAEFLKSNEFKFLYGCKNPGRNGTDEYSGLLWDDDLSNGLLANSACSLKARRILEKLNDNLRRHHGDGWPEVKHIVVAHCQIARAQRGGDPGSIPAHRVQNRENGYLELTTEGEGRRFAHSDADNHTINTECDGTIWRVDVAMSRAFVPGAQPFPRLFPCVLSRVTASLACVVRSGLKNGWNQKLVEALEAGCPHHRRGWKGVPSQAELGAAAASWSAL